MNLLDLLFPPFCLGCQRIGEYLCSHCLNKIQPISQPICPMCQKASMFGQTHSRCRKSLGLDGLISGFLYQGITKRAIGKFKYNLVSDLAPTLIEAWISLPDWNISSEEKLLMVPVPLHQNRYRWRGFNQAELLAQGLAQSFHCNYEKEILLRIKDTNSQMTLSAEKRKENLKDAFRLNYLAIKPRSNTNILLVDDVYTTGATLKEACKTLKRKHKVKVWGLTFARVVSS